MPTEGIDDELYVWHTVIFIFVPFSGFMPVHLSSFFEISRGVYGSANTQKSYPRVAFFVSFVSI